MRALTRRKHSVTVQLWALQSLLVRSTEERLAALERCVAAAEGQVDPDTLTETRALVAALSFMISTEYIWSAPEELPPVTIDVCRGALTIDTSQWSRPARPSTRRAKSYPPGTLHVKRVSARD